MRSLAAILLFVSVPVHLLAGAGLILDAKAKAFLAREDHMLRTGDLSEVSGDLVDEKTITEARDRSRQGVKAPAVTGLWIGGMALMILALAQVVAGVQVLRRRVSIVVLAIIGASVLALAVLLIREPTVVRAVEGVPVLLALLLAILVRSRSRAQTT
jgi:hypothetical protein